MDIRHAYEVRGSGKDLLLLHGNGENSNYFAFQMAEFSRSFRVWALDTRGHGNTPRGTGPFTISRFADDLLAFLDDHRIEKAILLGFSDGGNIALVFALRHPERVEKLILNGANLDTSGVEPRIQIPIELGFRAARLFSAFSPEAKRRMELLGLMVDSPNVPEKALREIKIPTLVIAGTHDLIRARETRRIAAAIPGAELAWIPGDHCIAAKNPEAFNRRVLQFLRAGEEENA